ncbi:MAG TPA: UDP-glucose 4-epimerase GalE [Polyangiaceae bacterium]
MTWLVTGGAGYIGAHVVRALRDAGFGVAILDDLSTGREEFVPRGVSLTRASVLDTLAVEAALREHAIDGVIHCAGFKYAGESVRRPLHTWRQNLAGTESLLRAMESVGVARIVFSGSAAVYGTPRQELVTEATPTAPESPYGESKLAAELLIRGQVLATAEAEAPLAGTSLRYFNVIGSADPTVFDVSPYNVLPRVFTGLIEGNAPVINGDDFDTPDGTCVRDYIDVGDVALAHVAAARAFAGGGTLEPVYNLGSGTGTSVRELIDAVLEVSGTSLAPSVGPRRPGDPARIVADGSLAARDLGWAMRHSVTDMVASAWKSHPKS